jgi:hypothetical protein
LSGELDQFLERGRVRRGRDYGRLLEDISRRRRELAEDVINVYRRVSPGRNPVLRRVLEVVTERKREVEPEHPDPEVTFGVDGGEGMREYQGVVLYVTRAAAWSESDVLSSWDFGVLSRTRTPQMRVAARRVKLESDVATRAVERGGEVVMLDGPIVPHHDLKGANEDSPNRRDYWGRILDARRTMLEVCEEEDAVVMGIVEDCKAKHLLRDVRDELGEDLPLKALPNDPVALSRELDGGPVLEVGERTHAFELPDEDYPVVREFEETAGYSVFTFYVRTTRYSPPVRVEIPEFVDPDEAAGIVLGTSIEYGGYGIPLPLVMADEFAKVSRSLVDWIEEEVLTELASDGRFDVIFTVFRRLRRESRPKRRSSAEAEREIHLRHGGEEGGA